MKSIKEILAYLGMTEEQFVAHRFEEDEIKAQTAESVLRQLLDSTYFNRSTIELSKDYTKNRLPDMKLVRLLNQFKKEAKLC